MTHRHPSPDELLDALDGLAVSEVRAHVDGCSDCRDRLADAREGLRLAAEAEVPEPPDAYWQMFPGHVARRAEEAPKGWWPRRAAPGLIAAAMALMAIGAALFARRPPPSHDVTLPEWSALPAGEDSSLTVLQAMEPTDEELRAAAGCLGAAECLAGLSEEESEALAEALRQDLPAGAGEDRLL